MARKSPYSVELRRRAVAMVADVRSEYDTEFAAITSVAKQLGIGSAETLRKWVRQAEIDAGKRSGITREEAAEIRALKRRVAELERANEILKADHSFACRRNPYPARRCHRFLRVAVGHWYRCHGAPVH